MVPHIPERPKAWQDPDFNDRPKGKSGWGRRPAWMLGTLVVLIGAGGLGLKTKAEAEAPGDPPRPGTWLIPTPLREVVPRPLPRIQIDPGLIHERGAEIDPRIIVAVDPEIDPGIFARRTARGQASLPFNSLPLGPPGSRPWIVPSPGRLAPIPFDPGFGPRSDRSGRSPSGGE